MKVGQKLAWTLILVLALFCGVCGTLAFVGGFTFFGFLAVPEEAGEAHLTELARSASPIIQALEHYRSEHQRFPTDPADLASYLPPVPATPPSTNPSFIRGWFYHRDPSGQGYSLAYKVGWDPNLIYLYSGSAGHWEYDPGDGTPSKTVHLKP